MIHTSRVQQMYAAASEWVDATLAEERNWTMARIAGTALAAVVVTALAWCVVVFAVAVSASVMGVPGGWWNLAIITGVMAGLYGWYGWRAVRDGQAPAFEHAPQWAAIPGLILGTFFAVVGGLFLMRAWVRTAHGNGLETGAAVADAVFALAFLGPDLAVKVWLGVQRYRQLQCIETDGCAEVVALLLERGTRVTLAELETLRPHLSITQLRNDLRLFEGVRLVPGPPVALALGSTAAEQLTTRLVRMPVAGAARALSA